MVIFNVLICKPKFKDVGKLLEHFVALWQTITFTLCMYMCALYVCIYMKFPYHYTQ